VSCE
jgi:hypothetical protein